MSVFDKPLKSSGQGLRNFETGAVRDKSEGKGRFDLLPPDALRALAVHFEKGAARYAARNWEKGIPYSKYIDSGLRHAVQALNGETDEPHAVAAAWNFLCLVQTMIWVEKGILPSTLNDLPVRGHVCNVEARAGTPLSEAPSGYVTEEEAAEEDEFWQDQLDGVSEPPPGTCICPPYGADEVCPVCTPGSPALDKPTVTARFVLLTPRPAELYGDDLGLEYIEFEGDQGFFVYTSGDRDSMDFPLSDYIGSPEYVSVRTDFEPDTVLIQEMWQDLKEVSDGECF